MEYKFHVHVFQMFQTVSTMDRHLPMDPSLQGLTVVIPASVTMGRLIALTLLAVVKVKYGPRHEKNIKV